MQQALAAVLLSAALSCRPDAAVARTLTKAPDLDNGARTFANVCSACHLGGARFVANYFSAFRNAHTRSGIPSR